jgi:alpha-methylacyl-CoA racemase
VVWRVKWVADVDGLVQPEPAPRLSRTPGAGGTAAPLVGEHTEAVLADFAFSESSVARLIELGAVFQAQAEPNESTHTQEQ